MLGAAFRERRVHIGLGIAEKSARMEGAGSHLVGNAEERPAYVLGED